MNTLTLEQIAPFLPYGLKYLNTKSGRIITMDYLYSVDEEIFIVCKEEQNHYSLKIWPFKPVLYPMSWLTKEIMLPGYDKPVVTLVELANFILPGRQWVYNKQKDAVEFEHFWFIKLDGNDNSFYYGVNYDKSNWEYLAISNQYALFQKLASWKFNFSSIPDELVEYVTEEFNPYIK